MDNNDYVQAISSVEDMPAVASGIVHSYCTKNNLDEADVYPTIWNDIITELNIKLFKPCNKLLKKNNAKYNDYDISKIEYIYINIYKRLCDSHCQEVSQKGFCDMSGIHPQTLYDWASGALSVQRSDLREKIMADNEESLYALMKDRRNNPMKYLPKLNKVHNWNMPGVSTRKDSERLLTAAELPKLDTSNCVKSIDNSKIEVIESDS